MPFTHQRMPGIAFATQQVGTQITMANIRSIAKAMNTGSICKVNANIVQHSRLVYKFLIQRKFRMTFSNLQCFISNGTTMNQQYMFQGTLFGIIFVNQQLRGHNAFAFIVCINSSLFMLFLAAKIRIILQQWLTLPHITPQKYDSIKL